MQQYKKLEELSVELFGEKNVTKDYISPDALELFINIKGAGHFLGRIEISLYPRDHRFFMLIDDFRFEYEDQEKALKDIKAYLEAIATHEVYIHSWNVLGIKFNKSLRIKSHYK